MTKSDSKPIPASSLARIGCYTGFLIAAVLVVASIHGAATGSEAPIPFQIAMLMTGLIEGLVCWQALRGNRVGWSFAMALNGTLTLAFFFGSPSVRDGLGVNTVLSLVPCLVFMVATIFLTLGSEDYGT